MTSIDRQFWNGKKVFLTGHTGFKGGWMALWLQDMGAKVVGYSLAPPTQPSLFDVARVSDGMISIEGDIRDLDNLKARFTEHAPDIVIHMAAQALVRPSYEDPVGTYETNVMGTVNLLEAVRQTDGAKVVLCVTSDKCYENREWAWGYREYEPMGGHDPYSSSKGCAELVAAAYRNSFFHKEDYEKHSVAVATSRAGNVIGGGDWAKDRLIPDIMKAIMDNRNATIRSPNAIRPWQYVLECIAGYLMLVEKLWVDKEVIGSWNFGPFDEDVKPVSWIADRLVDGWGKGCHWELDQQENLHEANYLKLDCSMARSILGFNPKLHIGTTLDWIVEWYRLYVQNADMRQATLDQIRRYEAL